MWTRIKVIVLRLPIVGAIALRLWRFGPWGRFPGSASYWESRYAAGGTSGLGSYGRLAEFKADVLNQFVVENSINSVIEFGCGDGNQLSLARYPRYVGLDVSRTAIHVCSTRFSEDKHKSFFLYDPTCFVDNDHAFAADLALSLDVLYHLVEDEVFLTYLTHLFQAATRFVVVFSSDVDFSTSSPYERHRNFTGWITRNLPGWVLIRRIPNQFPGSGANGGSDADFYIYARVPIELAGPAVE